MNIEEFLYKFSSINLGWDDLGRLSKALGTTGSKMLSIYDYESCTLYLTEKEEILRALDLLKIEYLVQNPSNTEVYLKQAL